MKAPSKILCLLTLALLSDMALAAETFHDAPPTAVTTKSPFKGRNQNAIKAGAAHFSVNCASCHGRDAMGSGNIPSLAKGPAQKATEGELFWFITKGSPENGMPASTLQERERWQVISYIKSLGDPTLKQVITSTQTPSSDDEKSPLPKEPFADYRTEKPGAIHKINVKDLPAPAPETSVGNGPEIVSRPAKAWPQVPKGFKVQLYASDLDNPRLLRTAPNGDIFLAESDSGKIRVFRGLTPDGKPKQAEVFTTGLSRPYGIAFYPPGDKPQWLYVGNTDSIVRFPYKVGDLHASDPSKKIADVPAGRGHWTRDVEFSLDGKRLFVGVGSASNVDDPDSTPREKNRADILVMTPEGEGQKVYAYGIRNTGGGMAVHPTTGVLWSSVNERDALGDNLVPDYITHVVEGGFYGWPWWYMGDHQDPRLNGKRPELKDKLITPDVLLQPHHASLQLIFYEGKQFPAEYRGDIFSPQHGSWNRSVRTGYDVIRVPLHGTTKASGEYEDFMTGFVVDSGHVWGRPVGVTTADDGSLLVSDDGSNSIWRISYVGK